MLRPALLALVAVGIVGLWVVNAFVFQRVDDETPGWLMLLWLALWGTLILLLAWTLMSVLRSRRRTR